MKFEDEVESALAQPSSLLVMRELAARLLSQGHPRDDVLQRFDAARLRLREQGRPGDEDVVTDVMDFIVGWCSPHMRLPSGS